MAEPMRRQDEIVAPGAPAAEQKGDAVPTLAEAKALTRCCVCESVKGTGQPVCQSDWLALTLAQRLAIAKAESPARADEAFAAAVRFLRGLPAYRRVRVIETRDAQGERRHSSWRLHSDAEMEAAGFRFIGYGQCQAPKCLGDVAWYWTPRGKRMAVSPRDYQPHAATCRDPEYGARRKEFQRQRRSAAMKAARRRRKA